MYGIPLTTKFINIKQKKNILPYLAIRRKVDLGFNFNFFTRFSTHLGQLQVLDVSLLFPTARKINELRYL